MLRIFFKSWRIALRTKRRFIVFTMAYAILLMWIAQLVRVWWRSPFDPILLTTLLYSMAGGAILGIGFSWWLAHGRRDDIATLKCIGWSNHDIRHLIIGEIIFVTIMALVVLTANAILLSGIYYIMVEGFWLGPPEQPPIVLPNPLVNFWVVPAPFMWVAFGVVMLTQLPGILVLTWRILRVSPMRALRRAE